MFFIGFVIVFPAKEYEYYSDPNMLNFSIISEAYDTDLNSFYRDETNRTPYKDNKIRDNLLDLFNKLSQKPFYRICFDIKPENCVINEKTLDVKLIDLDGDFCHNFSHYLKKKSDLPGK